MALDVTTHALYVIHKGAASKISYRTVGQVRQVSDLNLEKKKKGIDLKVVAYGRFQLW